MQISYGGPAGRPQLGVDQVERLLDFLRSERTELRQTLTQKFLYGLQAFATFGYALALAVLALCYVFSWDTAGVWAAGLFMVMLPLSALLLLINLAVMRRFRERLRLVKHLGLRGIVDVSWRREAGQRRFGAFWSSLGLILGVLWVLATLVGLVVALFDTEAGAMEVLFYVIVASTPGVLLIAFYLMRKAHRRNALLSDVNLLGKLLHERKEAAVAAEQDAIDFSPKLRRSIEELERARIDRQREEAIQRSYAARPSKGFRVSRSTRSLLASAELPSEAVALSEKLIAELGGDPRPEGAEQEGPLWKLRDEASGIEVHYEVDDADRLIKVRDIVGASSEE